MKMPKVIIAGTLIKRDPGASWSVFLQTNMKTTQLKTQEGSPPSEQGENKMTNELTMIEDFLPPGSTKLTPVSLELNAELTMEQWKTLGKALAKCPTAYQWWIGDWWAFGEHKYGDRKKLVKSKEWTGPAFGTCMHAAVTCRAFETCRRRHVLSFNHHREVRSLDSAEADRLLDWCEEPLKNGANKPRSSGKLRKLVRQNAPSPKRPAKPAKQVKSLTVHKHSGTAHIENPLPSWHVVDDATTDNNQTIVCIECWTISYIGTTAKLSGKSAGMQGNWFYKCRCKNGQRSATLKSEKQ
jgi:hypothetical protein